MSLLGGDESGLANSNSLHSATNNPHLSLNELVGGLRLLQNSFHQVTPSLPWKKHGLLKDLGTGGLRTIRPAFTSACGHTRVTFGLVVATLLPLAISLASAAVARMPFVVTHRKDAHTVGMDTVVDGVWESLQMSLPSASTGWRECLGIDGDRIQRALHGSIELVAQAVFTFVIPHAQASSTSPCTARW